MCELTGFAPASVTETSSIQSIYHDNMVPGTATPHKGPHSNISPTNHM